MFATQKVIVPRFDSHCGSFATLNRDSWESIFANVYPDKEPAGRFWRKYTAVRIGRKDAFYVSRAHLHGLYHSSDDWYRRMYGLVLFHVRHDQDRTIPFNSQTQLVVQPNNQILVGNVSSVSVFITELTRFTEETWKYDVRKKVRFQESKVVPVTNDDYDYGLLKADKMKEYIYHPPPLKDSVLERS